MDVRPYNDETKKIAIELLKHDGVIVAPSVTNYGVFCSAYSKKGISRIFQMKNRTKFGPLTLGISSPEHARLYANIPNEFSSELMHELLFGLTTIIFNKSVISTEFPEQMTNGAPTVGLFCHGKSPMYEIGREFGPIALTSSNISGTGGFQVTREQAINDLGSHADLVIDGGPIVWDHSSGDFQSNTVVDFSFNPPHLVREGRYPTHRLLEHFPNLITDINKYKVSIKKRMGNVRL